MEAVVSADLLIFAAENESVADATAVAGEDGDSDFSSTIGAAGAVPWVNLASDSTGVCVFTPVATSDEGDDDDGDDDDVDDDAASDGNWTDGKSVEDDEDDNDKEGADCCAAGASSTKADLGAGEAFSSTSTGADLGADVVNSIGTDLGAEEGSIGADLGTGAGSAGAALDAAGAAAAGAGASAAVTGWDGGGRAAWGGTSMEGSGCQPQRRRKQPKKQVCVCVWKKSTDEKNKVTYA